MDAVSLTDTLSRDKLFRHLVTKNVSYWHTWANNHLVDVLDVDRERDNIIRAISFALDLEETAWSTVRPLIELFSPYVERRGIWENWSDLLSRAIIVARQLGDLEGAANLLGILARLLYRQSRFRESVAAYRQAIHLSRQIQYRFGEARACTNLGYFYVESGYWYRAEVLCCYALEIFKQINNDHGQAHTENHLGILYTRLGLWEKAQQHLDQACHVWQTMGDDHGLMSGLVNLSLLYLDQERPDEALLSSKKALRQATLTGEELQVGIIHMNIGFAYKLKGDLTQAEQYSRQAEKIFRHFSTSQWLTNVLENLGVICFEQQRWDEAILHLEATLAARRASSSTTPVCPRVASASGARAASAHSSSPIPQPVSPRSPMTSQPTRLRAGAARRPRQPRISRPSIRLRAMCPARRWRLRGQMGRRAARAKRTGSSTTIAALRGRRRTGRTHSGRWMTSPR